MGNCAGERYRSEIRLLHTKALICSQLEYVAPVLSPHRQTEINIIEKVQRTAAHWTSRCWHNQGHVGLEELQSGLRFHCFLKTVHINIIDLIYGHTSL